jgi:stage II sporulation protein E
MLEPRHRARFAQQPRAPRRAVVAWLAAAQYLERDAALECVNRLLMQHGGQDMYATVDALHVDLSSGAAEFIKFGAPPSFVLREGRVHTIYAEALPAGILDEASPAIHTATLKRNDSVVLLTDGALDALGEDTTQEIIACVGGANTCEDAARTLLQAAQDHGYADDMSVLVIRLE